MIKKEDIKVGMEFVLPFREDEYEEEVIRYRERLINDEDFPVLPMYKTDLETLDEFQKTIVTFIRPIFKVAGSPREYFKTSSEHRYLGIFVKVVCNKIKDKVFYLSTKYIMESGEILNKENLEPKLHECPSTEDAKAFKSITDKMSDTYKRKNHDYGNAFSEMYDELGINYGYGKIREKVNRIKTLKDNEAQVANEPLEDALLDCANYCILTLMEYQKRKEHGTD